MLEILAQAAKILFRLEVKSPSRKSKFREYRFRWKLILLEWRNSSIFREGMLCGGQVFFRNYSYIILGRTRSSRKNEWKWKIFEGWKIVQSPSWKALWWYWSNWWWRRSTSRPSFGKSPSYKVNMTVPRFKSLMISLSYDILTFDILTYDILCDLDSG